MKCTHPYYPVIYVRGFAMTQQAVEDTVADPYMGFNLGSTKTRQTWRGNRERLIFESPLLRLMKDHGYRDVYDRVCAVCHGRNLETAGVAAQDLRAFPIGESARFIRSVTHGSGDMPPFGKLLSEAEISNIFDYVRAMQAAGP